MLDQRNRGFTWILGVLIGLINLFLFFGFLAAEAQFEIFGLINESRTWVYALGIPLSLLYSRHVLKLALQQVRSPSLWHSALGSVRIATLQAISVFGIYFLLKDVGLSRAFLLGYVTIALVLNFLLLFTLPTLVSQLFIRTDPNLRAILYGLGPLPEDLRDYVLYSRTMGMRFIGYYADEQQDLPGVEWLGTADEVMTCEGGRKHVRVEVAFAYCDADHLDRFRDGIDRCTRRGARIQVYSNLSRTFPDPVRVNTDGNLLFFTFFNEPLQNPINRFIKRAFDIAISLPVVLFMVPPLMLLVWTVHRLQSPGPLFFRQVRYGIGRKPFTIFKFRTMHVHSRKLEGRQATRGDERIFAFGAFLRKTSLDEFPQFINALRGDMSVVGPRPHLTLHDDDFERYYRRYRSRHFAKPGITGLAQVSGYRGEMPNEEAVIGRIQRDLEYITQWSVRLEIYIFLKTIWQVIVPPKTAY